MDNENTTAETAKTDKELRRVDAIEKLRTMAKSGDNRQVDLARLLMDLGGIDLEDKSE